MGISLVGSIGYWVLGNVMAKNASSSTTTSDHPHKGHYLFDMYSPTRSQNDGVKYAHKDNTLKMDNKDVYEAFLLSTLDGKDTEVTFKIEKGKYKTLCFFAGVAENYFTHYNFHDKCALSVWAGTETNPTYDLLYEEMFYGLGPSRYASVDITNAEYLTFFVSKQYSMSCLGVAEVTLWEDANHSIAPAVPHAYQNEDFLDNTYFVYGDGTNGADTIAHVDDGTEAYSVLKDGKYVTVDGQRVTKGVAFTSSSWFSEDANQKFVINAMGRYKYLHFNLGHIDTSKTDGSLYVRVSVDLGEKYLFMARDYELPQEITIPVNYGKVVTFELFPAPDEEERTDMFSFGSYCIYNMIGSPNAEFPASAKEEIKYEGSYKMISQVNKPFSLVTNVDADEALLTGKTAFSGLQMGGVLYTEGVVLRPAFNMWTTSVEAVPARASFNLHKAFKNLTFRVGRRDKSPLVSDTLKVYLDEELKQTIGLSSMGAVDQYSIDCTGASTVKFEIVGVSDTYRGTYGVVDIGVHTGEVQELNFIHTPTNKKAASGTYSPGQTAELMKDIYPYESLSKQNEQDLFTADRNDTAEYLYNDGRSFTTIDGASHDMGFLLQSGTYLSLGGGGAAVAMTCMAIGFVLLVPMGMSDVNAASLAAFNLMGKFSTLSFKVLPTVTGGKAESLSLVTPEGTFKDVTLSPTQETAVEVDVTGISEFSFFLRFSDGGSVPFAFYDLVITA